MTLHEKIRYLLVSAMAALLMLVLMFPTEEFQNVFSRVLGFWLAISLLYGFYGLVRRGIEWCLEQFNL